MKSLIDIVESQIVGDIGVTFDLFKKFFEDDPEAKREIDTKFKKRFGKRWVMLRDLFDESLQRISMEMNQMNVDIDDNILMFMYDKIKETPVSKIDKIIGMGEEACVFDLGDKIIKCYYNNRIPEHTRKFFEMCIKDKPKVFPKVYRIGKGYVIMEKVTPRTPKTQKMFSLLYKVFNINGIEDTLYHIIQDKKYVYNKLNSQQKEIVDFMEEIRERLKELAGNDFNMYGDFGDFHRDNVGERPDGSMVYFDI